MNNSKEFLNAWKSSYLFNVNHVNGEIPLIGKVALDEIWSYIKVSKPSDMRLINIGNGTYVLLDDTDTQPKLYTFAVLDYVRFKKSEKYN